MKLTKTEQKILTEIRENREFATSKKREVNALISLSKKGLVFIASYEIKNRTKKDSTESYSSEVLAIIWSYIS